MHLVIIDFIQKKYQPFPSIPYTKEIEDFVFANLNRMNEKLDLMLDCKSDVELNQLGVNTDDFV